MAQQGWTSRGILTRLNGVGCFWKRQLSRSIEYLANMVAVVDDFTRVLCFRLVLGWLIRLIYVDLRWAETTNPRCKKSSRLRWRASWSSCHAATPAIPCEVCEAMDCPLPVLQQPVALNGNIYQAVWRFGLISTLWVSCDDIAKIGYYPEDRTMTWMPDLKQNVRSCSEIWPMTSA